MMRSEGNTETVVKKGVYIYIYVVQCTVNFCKVRNFRLLGTGLHLVISITISLQKEKYSFPVK
jgi:hypothetical protein